MTITREQVADLQPGDVVEVSGYRILRGATLQGPVRDDRGGDLAVGPLVVRFSDGRPPVQFEDDEEHTLTVVSRAPRPLYVNHPRTEPVPGDVVRDEEADLALIVLRVAGQRFPDKWIDQYGTERTYEHLSPSRRLRLLVDGETGQAVQ